MKKLTLEVDALRVESFEVPDAGRVGGTVRAHAGAWLRDTGMTQCLTGLCDCYLTDPSCNAPCG